ncbi:MAG: hypothetical protein ACT4P2_14150 [Pseudomonadota bacterium]
MPSQDGLHGFLLQLVDETLFFEERLEGRPIVGIPPLHFSIRVIADCLSGFTRRSLQADRGKEECRRLALIGTNGDEVGEVPGLEKQVVCEIREKPRIRASVQLAGQLDREIPVAGLFGVGARPATEKNDPAETLSVERP